MLYGTTMLNITLEQNHHPYATTRTWMSARDRAKVEQIVRRIKRLRRDNARHTRRFRHWVNELWRRYDVAYLQSHTWSTKLAAPTRGLTIRNFGH